MILIGIIVGILAVVCIAGLFVFFKEIKNAPLIKEDEEELMRRLNGE